MGCASPRRVSDGDGAGEGVAGASATGVGDVVRLAASVTPGVGRGAVLTIWVGPAAGVCEAAGRAVWTALTAAGLAGRWATWCRSLTPTLIVAAAASTAASLSAAELATAAPRPPPAAPTGAA